MDGVIDMDGARALVGNAALWPRVRDFLWDFAPSIHESWLDGLGTSDFARDFARSEVRGANPSPRVKRFVLESLGVEPCFHAFPKDDGSRLLLLDFGTLASVAKWLGALACADALRKVLDGGTVRALKTALPGVYPEVFGYTAYFGGFCSRHGGAEAQKANLPDDVLAEGYALLHSAVSSLPGPLLHRLECKLPKQDAQRLCASATGGPIAFSTVLKLLKLKFPEAYSLCCS